MKKINFIDVEFLRGDVTKLTAEALIVPQHYDAVYATPLTKRLKYCGAEDGIICFEQFIKRNSVFWGDTLITSAGGNTKQLIHVVMLGGETKNAFEIIQKSIWSVLKTADENGYTSLVFPLTQKACSFWGVTSFDAVSMILQSIGNFSNLDNRVKEFAIVLDEDDKSFSRIKDKYELCFNEENADCRCNPFVAAV